MRAVAVLVLALALASPALAKSWRMLPEKSTIGFEATQVGAVISGRFAAFQADIRFDPASLNTARATIVVAIESVDTGNEERDSEIVGPDWFDTANHPTALFDATAFRRDGSDYVASAQLTLRGTTRAVELPFTLSFDGQTAVMQGEVTVSRTEFGIGRGQWVDTAVVGDEVRIQVRVEAVADSTQP